MFGMPTRCGGNSQHSNHVGRGPSRRTTVAIPNRGVWQSCVTPFPPRLGKLAQQIGKPADVGPVAGSERIAACVFIHCRERTRNFVRQLNFTVMTFPNFYLKTM